MMTDNDSLVLVSTLIDPPLSSIFRYETFNKVQSIMAPIILKDDSNLIIASPTGSGKTALHELAIVRLLQTKPIKDVKCVFIAPNKALCQQRANEWKETFGKLGLNVLEVTGDIDIQQSLRFVAQASIIITTPEKWDSLTRSWRRYLYLLGVIDLMLIDEIHHLGEERGATLETVIVRMRILSETYAKKIAETKKLKNTTDDITTPSSHVRIIALSATLPNIVDIGVWLGCTQDGIHYFDDGFRPIPLTVHILTYPNFSNTFLFEKSLDNKVSDVVNKYSEGKQTLIFCSSKNSTESLSMLLSQRLRWNNSNLKNSAATTQLINSISDANLRNLVSKGFAYHHAGLSPDDRAAVENLYLSGSIVFLCSTSTLAHGVNLPAHLVIIKGTNSWRGGSRGYERMAKSEVIQMMGRAGRKGFDEEGVAVIMTSEADKSHFSDVSLSADVVESTLPAKLTEAICSEISQTVIESVGEALRWIKSTYFYVRVKRDPETYGYKDVTNETQLEEVLERVCINSVNDLSEAKIITYDPETKKIAPNTEAHIMTRHIISFKTMVMIMNLPNICSLSKLLLDLSHSYELQKPVRRMDKKVLNDYMKQIRFPLKTTVKESHLKTYVLLQVAVARYHIADFTMRVEMSEITEITLRILSALQDTCIERLKGQLLENALILERSLRNRMWENAVGIESVLLQCPDISEGCKKKLTEKSLLGFEDMINLSVSEIQSTLLCNQHEARTLMIFTRICHSSKFQVSLKSTSDTTDHHNNNLLEVCISPYFNNHSSTTTQMTNQLYQGVDYCPKLDLICYDETSGTLVCHRKLKAPFMSQTFTVPLLDKMQYQYIKAVLVSNIVGLDFIQPSFHSVVNQQTLVEAPLPLPPPPPPKSTSTTRKKNTKMDQYYKPSENVPLQSQDEHKVYTEGNDDHDHDHDNRHNYNDNSENDDYNTDKAAESQKKIDFSLFEYTPSYNVSKLASSLTSRNDTSQDRQAIVVQPFRQMQATNNNNSNSNNTNANSRRMIHKTHTKEDGTIASVAASDAIVEDIDNSRINDDYEGNEWSFSIKNNNTTSKPFDNHSNSIPTTNNNNNNGDNNHGDNNMVPKKVNRINKNAFNVASTSTAISSLSKNKKQKVSQTRSSTLNDNFTHNFNGNNRNHNKEIHRTESSTSPNFNTSDNRNSSNSKNNYRHGSYNDCGLPPPPSMMSTELMLMKQKGAEMMHAADMSTYPIKRLRSAVTSGRTPLVSPENNNYNNSSSSNLSYSNYKNNNNTSWPQTNFHNNNNNHANISQYQSQTKPQPLLVDDVPHNDSVYNTFDANHNTFNTSNTTNKTYTADHRNFHDLQDDIMAEEVTTVNYRPAVPTTTTTTQPQPLQHHPSRHQSLPLLSSRVHYDKIYAGENDFFPNNNEPESLLTPPRHKITATVNTLHDNSFHPQSQSMLTHILPLTQPTLPQSSSSSSSLQLPMTKDIFSQSNAARCYQQQPPQQQQQQIPSFMSERPSVPRGTFFKETTVRSWFETVDVDDIHDDDNNNNNCINEGGGRQFHNRVNHQHIPPHTIQRRDKNTLPNTFHPVYNDSSQSVLPSRFNTNNLNDQQQQQQHYDNNHTDSSFDNENTIDYRPRPKESDIDINRRSISSNIILTADDNHNWDHFNSYKNDTSSLFKGTSSVVNKKMNSYSDTLTKQGIPVDMCYNKHMHQHSHNNSNLDHSGITDEHSTLRPIALTLGLGLPASVIDSSSSSSSRDRGYEHATDVSITKESLNFDDAGFF